MDDDDDITTKLFKNPEIMSKIYNKIDGGLMKNLYFRQISKLFNTTCIAVIEKMHSNLKIEYFGDEHFFGVIERHVEKATNSMDFGQNLDDLPPELQARIQRLQTMVGEIRRDNRELGRVVDRIGDPNLKVCISFNVVKENKVGSYLRFLRQINIPIEKVHLKYLWKLRDITRKAIHNALFEFLHDDKNVSALIGMDSLCKNCDFGRQLSMYCKEYGPINELNVARPRTCKIYQRLVIDHLFLQSAAEKGQTIEQMYQELDQHWHKRFQCDTLELHIPEATKRLVFNEQGIELDFTLDHSPLPQELIHYFIDRFEEVQTVTLKFCKETRSGTYQDEKWTEKEYLSKFKFNDSFDTVKILKTRPKIKEVIVDLTESKICSNGIEGYKNLIANIRRVFETNHISLVFPHWILSGTNIFKVLNNFFTTIFHEHQVKLRVDIFYHAKMEQLTYRDEFDVMRFQVLSFPLRFGHRVLSNKANQRQAFEKVTMTWKDRRFVEENWIGRSIRIKDLKFKCIINWAIMIREEELANELSMELIRANPNSLLLYFAKLPNGSKMGGS